MCLYWCSLAIMVPFKLNGQMVEDLLFRARKKLFVYGRECKAAAILLAALLKRENNAGLERGMFEWLKDNLNGDNINFRLGALNFLAALTKDRNSEKWIMEILQICQLIKVDSSMLSKKLILKIRTQLVYLFPDHIHLIEEAIETALQSLSEKDTVIRWSAAKSLGSICKRLDIEQRLHLISMLFPAGEFHLLHPDLLHGLALSFAELLRNGVDCSRIAQRLASFTIFCLSFELSKGTYAIGSQVRDAACYICWAWIRYSGGLIKNNPDLIGKLSCGLLAMSIFDREISCRRAASAAFQEFVGRSQCVPYGIQIIGEVHFYSINNKERCFGELASVCLNYDHYHEALINHLLQISLKCFDKSIRCLASHCLGKAVICKSICDELLLYALSEDLVLQHSGLITLAQILPAQYINLSKINQKMASFAQISNKALGYELLAESWLVFIDHAANTGITFSEMWIEIVRNALSSRFSALHRLGSLVVLPSIISKHGDDRRDIMASFFRTVLLPGADKSHDINVQRGYSLALGAMPRWLLLERQRPLAILLCRLAQTTSPINDIEKRCNIIESIQRLFSLSQLDPEIRENIYVALINLIDDYSIDSRGDVGSKIREAAMKALAIMTPINVELSIKFMGKLLSQAVDRLDRVRWTAFEILSSLLMGEGKNEWNSMLGDAGLKLLPLNKDISLQEFMSRISVLLHSENFRKPLLLGWINSAGCTNPNIVSVQVFSGLILYLGRSFLGSAENTSGIL